MTYNRFTIVKSDIKLFESFSSHASFEFAYFSVHIHGGIYVCEFFWLGFLLSVGNEIKFGKYWCEGFFLSYGKG